MLHYLRYREKYKLPTYISNTKISIYRATSTEQKLVGLFITIFGYSNIQWISRFGILMIKFAIYETITAMTKKFVFTKYFENLINII